MKNRIVACVLAMTLVSGSFLSGCSARTVAVKTDENADNASSQSSDEETDVTETETEEYGTDVEDEAGVTTGCSSTKLYKDKCSGTAV